MILSLVQPQRSLKGRATRSIKASVCICLYNFVAHSKRGRKQRTGEQIVLRLLARDAEAEEILYGLHLAKRRREALNHRGS